MAVTSIILFKDNKRAGVPVTHHRVRPHNANDNIRSMEFDMAEHERNWCSLAVFSLLLLVGAVSIVSPFFSIFTV
ncbi:hypothetical protein G6M17_07945 [Agrobacterium tumefaciens]|uniref:hypothetical protein n=1 Tax=Rhizobium/Agrobacterium group TaxID=227290 RepID=UPI0007E0DAF7|nr:MULTISPECIES: hypothetical protein [Rhizobium/Agrobacterium group]MBO0125096.1 hypothetical protein [Agrobacterium sp. OT33]NSX90717.1 hypothetical protein [Agrobacterium tumefaciens]NSZ79078.1 hypothetical protein [Agrobacterium tumefaciens]NTE55690.1 hypothetical protein [Agrobacterium tumefaciens]NTE71512.1 hypothetical protein [Agrobacterium tumefaciens]